MPEIESKRSIWNKIHRLDLPRKTKEMLRNMWHRAKAIVQALVNWLCQHRQFCSTVMLGVALAYLVHPLPWVGPILSTLSISLAVLYGLALQVRADLDRHFSCVIQECAA